MSHAHSLSLPHWQKQRAEPPINTEAQSPEHQLPSLDVPPLKTSRARSAKETQPAPPLQLPVIWVMEEEVQGGGRERNDHQ